MDPERIDERAGGKDILESVLYIAFRRSVRQDLEVEGVSCMYFAEAVGQLHVEFLSLCLNCPPSVGGERQI